MPAPFVWLGWFFVVVIALNLFAMLVFHPFVSFLDWWSSRITADEARRRARLSLAGHWHGEQGYRWTALIVLALGIIVLELLRS
jgi:hypothetical protein